MQAMNTPDLRWQLAATGAARSAPAQPASWSQRARLALGSPAGVASAIALLVGLGLLVAFQQVVSGAVLQGELRRAAVVAPTNSDRSVLRPPRRAPALVKSMEK